MAKKAAKSSAGGAKRPEFLGRVVQPSPDAMAPASGMTGPHQVWFPVSPADVATAVGLSQHLKTFIRSGTQTAASDAVDASGGVVINLAALKKLSVKKGVLYAEAAATIGDIADELAENNLALPLVGNPHQSAASGVLHGGPSVLMRTLGPLSDYVSRLDAVTPAGAARVVRAAGRSVARSREAKDVLTQVAFKPVSADGLWMSRVAIPYPGKASFAALVAALFSDPRLPPRSDLVLDALSSRYDMPVLRITAAGAVAEDEATVGRLVAEALATLPADLFNEGIIREKRRAGPDVVRTLADEGLTIPRDRRVDATRVRRVVERGAGVDDFFGQLAEDVDRGLAFNPDKTGKRDERLRLFTRLQLNRDGELELSGVVYTPRPVGISVPTSFASLAPVARVDSLNGLLLATGLTATVAGVGLIPNFAGDVYEPSDPDYPKHAAQYATSSHAPADMTPSLVAYPRDVADIQAALAFAVGRGKRVVTRSGGHQYSGLSSGSGTTVVLDMRAFKQFVVITSTAFNVGPAVPLTDLAALFLAKGVTVPHGECPFVCVGGHAQTGGYGHLLRSFGLMLDHVTAFTIVLADGTEQTVTRPAGAPVTPDDELFWGVLGGNAGSFGVVTNYRFECVRDLDHPGSYCYVATRWYRSERYRDLMKQAQSWTQGIVAGTLPPQLDFMMTVESKPRWYLPSLMLVEVVHSNTQVPNGVADRDRFFEPIIAATDADAFWFETLVTTEGPELLSSLSDSFVRREPTTTPDGREFPYPYRKRLNCTAAALTDAFIEGLVLLIEKVVMHSPDIYLIFQMAFGGGEYQNSPKKVATAIPRRGLVFCFVFDLFYDTGMQARAEQLQVEMQLLIDTHFSPAQEQRLFWGSFGDTDITKQSVIDYYYDDPKTYPLLQLLKQRVDPGDTFHTLLTVKLPAVVPPPAGAGPPP